MQAILSKHETTPATDEANASHVESRSEILKHEEHKEGTIKIGNLVIPAKVAAQLKAEGHTIESYTEDQLRQAIDACKIDSNLIADPYDHSFQGKLSLESHEADADKHHDDLDVMNYRRPHGVHLSTSSKPASWVDRTGASAPIASESYAAQVKSEREKAEEHSHQHNAA